MDQSISQPALAGAKLPIVRSPRLKVEHLWLLMPVCIVVWMSFMHPLRKLDFWWHLKVGEIIVSTRAVPTVDLFSYTRGGEPFAYQNWLGEVLYYLIYVAGGFPLLTFFNTILLLIALLPVYHLCLRANPRLRVAILCGLVAAFVLGLYSNMRPQSYSFALFAVFYWVLWMYREQRRDVVWVLPLLMVLWVNLHGAFVLGIAMIVMVLGGETVRRLLLGPAPTTLPSHALAKLALITLVTVAATVANPETIDVFAYVHKLQVDPASQLFVKEWQVPDIKKLSDVLVFYGPFFVALLVLLYTRRRPDLTELGLFLGFTVLALAALRSGIWFALIAAPILARHAVTLDVPDLVGGLCRRLGLAGDARRLQPSKRLPKRPLFARLNWFILAWLALFTVAVSPWVRPHLKAGRLSRDVIEASTPIGAMDYIAEHHLKGNIFHTQDYGDYLIWRLWPEQKSFIDGRVHLFDGSFVRDYILTFHDDRWESRIARYDIKYLLLPKNDERTETMIKDARAAKHWQLLYEDDVSILFERRPDMAQTLNLPGSQP